METPRTRSDRDRETPPSSQELRTRAGGGKAPPTRGAQRIQTGREHRLLWKAGAARALWGAFLSGLGRLLSLPPHAAVSKHPQP